MKLKLLIVFTLITIAIHAKDVLYQCDFSKGKWEASEWQIIKSPRWSYIGDWEQHPDHIANKVPKNASEEEMLNKRAGETYTSMILKEKFSQNLTITSTMSFDYRMAPAIVITPGYGKDADDNLEHREHFEIVLFDKGLNVWHHYYTDGKPYWKKAAFIDADFESKNKYSLSVEIKTDERGTTMIVSCEGKTFGFMDDSIPKMFYVGITGCEGVNRFYDFQISK